MNQVNSLSVSTTMYGSPDSQKQSWQRSILSSLLRLLSLLLRAFGAAGLAWRSEGDVGSDRITVPLDLANSHAILVVINAADPPPTQFGEDK